MPDSSEKPIFGQPPDRRFVSKPEAKGQAKLGLDKELPSPKSPSLSLEVQRRRKLQQTRAYEKQKTEWEDLVLNEGTRSEIKLKGRYYEIAKDPKVEPLGVFNKPPRSGNAKRIGNLQGGETVFIVKDSEKADDRLRKGWAEVVVLDKDIAEDKLKVRSFSDGLVNEIILCRALYQGIIERQVIK